MKLLIVGGLLVVVLVTASATVGAQLSVSAWRRMRERNRVQVVERKVITRCGELTVYAPKRAWQWRASA